MMNDLEGIFEALSILEQQLKDVKSKLEELEDRVAKLEKIVTEYFKG